MVAVLKTAVLKAHILREMPSQAVFARKIRISPSHLSQLLSGQRNASGDVRQRMLEETGREFDELFELQLPQQRDPSQKTLLRMAKRRVTAKRRRR